MITRERLEELIKQGATIYTTYGGYISEINLHRKYDYSTDNHLFEADIVAGEVGFRKYTFNILFETEEEAEWHQEFGNITRSERLELPTWEEFDNKGYFEFVAKTGTALILEKTLVIDFGKKPIGDYDLNILIKNDYNHTSLFRAECNKENYTLACRKCKELFLGEDNENNR